MTRETTGYQSKHKGAAFIGGIIGLAVFLIVGLLPSLLYGGYAGVIMGSAIFGSPIHEHVFAQATVILGVLVGVLSIGGMFILAGAIIATGVYGLVSVNQISKARQVSNGVLHPEKSENRREMTNADAAQSLSPIQGETLAESLH